MEQLQNARVGKTGDLRENLQARGIVRNDSHIRKSWSNPAVNRTRYYPSQRKPQHVEERREVGRQPVRHTALDEYSQQLGRVGQRAERQPGDVVRVALSATRAICSVPTTGYVPCLHVNQSLAAFAGSSSVSYNRFPVRDHRAERKSERRIEQVSDLGAISTQNPQRNNTLGRGERLTSAVALLALQPAKLVERLGAAERCVHLVGVVEEAVVDLVLARLLAECHQRLEAVPPQDLVRQVRRPRLRRHARRLDHACARAHTQQPGCSLLLSARSSLEHSLSYTCAKHRPTYIHHLYRLFTCTKASRVNFPKGSFPNFYTLESWRTMPLVSGFFRPCIPAQLHSHLTSHSSAIKTAMLRAAQMSPLHWWLHESWRHHTETRGSDKGDTATRIKRAIADKRKAPKLRAVLSSHCRYDGNTARLARWSDEALGVRVSVARVAREAALTFEDDDDLEALAHHLGGGEGVERAGRVYLVHDGGGPDEEDLVFLAVAAHLQFLLVVRQQLALLRHLQHTTYLPRRYSPHTHTHTQSLHYNPFARSGRLLTSRSSEPMRVIEVSMEQLRNERVGETGDPRENPATSGINSGLCSPRLRIGAMWIRIGFSQATLEVMAAIAGHQQDFSGYSRFLHDYIATRHLPKKLPNTAPLETYPDSTLASPEATDLPLDELGAYVRLHDVRLAHVADAEHEAEEPVPLADDGVPAEEQCLRALLRARQLGEHDADHEGLYHNSGDALQAHHEDGLGALLCSVSRPVAYGVLRLDAEEEAGREAVHLADAGRPVGVRDIRPEQRRDLQYNNHQSANQLVRIFENHKTGKESAMARMKRTCAQEHLYVFKAQMRGEDRSTLPRTPSTSSVPGTRSAVLPSALSTMQFRYAILRFYYMRYNTTGQEIAKKAERERERARERESRQCTDHSRIRHADWVILLWNAIAAFVCMIPDTSHYDTTLRTVRTAHELFTHVRKLIVGYKGNVQHPPSSTDTYINPPLHAHPDALMKPKKIPDCFATRHNTVTEVEHIVHWAADTSAFKCTH
ncbi:hypothetical protein PR048_004826 [Dryococelus australis]|uniref:Uncharacterized protein n=1 Tax=Dryococelus australis TaxID=614101 RepID=A0ABQ9I6G9_9NEOP|nr:hypothetical protein PR048_004826 [Dryococelus australis]